jgi:AcrR family transcriptional regulator
MSDTKERIMMAALELFARDGYEAVPVSAIADEVGITKGALYKHYKNKRDIFDHIVARMFEVDAERARQYDVPDEGFDDGPEKYRTTEAASIKNFTLAQLNFWTEDAFASNYRKMLSLERFRNPEMAKLYSDTIVAGPVGYMEDLFREMMEHGALKKADPKVLALEYYAPLFLLIEMWDTAENKATLKSMLAEHIDKFMS